MGTPAEQNKSCFPAEQNSDIKELHLRPEQKLKLI